MDSEKRKYKTLEEMYLDTYKLIYTFIYDYTKDWVVAEEISSTLWMKVAESPDIYLKKDVQLLHNYMRVMAKNEIMQHFRMLARQKGKIEKMVVSMATPRTIEEEYIFQENLKELKKARNQLSEEESRLLDLRFEKNCSIRETSEELGINISAMKMRQQRILSKLKKLID